MTKLIKFLLWKLELVDLIWVGSKLRIVRTNSENGARFVKYRKDANKTPMYLNVDSFLDSGNENKSTMYDYNLRTFKGLKFDKNYRFFKTQKVKNLQRMASVDRALSFNNQTKEEFKHGGEIQVRNDGLIASSPFPPLAQSFRSSLDKYTKLLTKDV